MKKLLPSFLFLAIVSTQVSLAQNITLWGMTNKGPTLNDTTGIVFRLSLSTGTFTNVHNFSNNDTDGYQPWGSLCKASDGKLYGMTEAGGMSNEGVLFSYDPVSSNYTILIDFGPEPVGEQPYGSLIQASNGRLYGMTSGGYGTADGIIFSYNPANSDYIIDYNFLEGTDGYFPEGSLIQATNGKLYGTTTAGGSHNDGTIFSFNPKDSVYSVIYNFGSVTDDGLLASGDLVQASDGNLYGATTFGGIYTKYGGGVIFSCDTLGNNYKVVHDFGNGTDGYSMNGNLTQANDGKLYGMTLLGGVDSSGIIFSYDPTDSSYHDVHNFNYYTEGGFPFGSLMLASDGNLYGMASDGGVDTFGTIFSFDPQNSTLTVVHNFDGTEGYFIWFANNLIEDDISTGINQLIVNTNQLSIYPNPTSGIIKITSSKNMDELKVTNVLGQLIYEAQPKQQQFTFELKDAGMYFVSVMANNHITTGEVVVDK